MLLPTVCCLLVAGTMAGPAQRASTLQAKSQDHWATLQDSFSQLKSLVPAANLSALNSDATPRDLIGPPDAYILPPGLYFLKSPRFPLRYPNNYDETWDLDGTDGQDLTISCWYKIQPSSACSLDYLSINGDIRCGIGSISITSDLNRQARHGGSALAVHFVTDPAGRRLGFVCVVKVPEPPP